MKEKLFGVLLGIAAIGMIASPGYGAGDDEVQLGLHLQKGQIHKLRTITNQKISRTIQGQQVEVTQTTAFGYLFSVENIEGDGTALVKVSYRSVLFKQDGPMGAIEYDSSNPPAAVHPMAKGFAALAGQSFTMTLSPDAEIKEVQGVDVMLEDMMKKLDLPDEPLRQRMETALKRRFGAQALKEMMENTLRIFPDRPVAIGESWTRTLRLAEGFPIIVEETRTLKAREGGVATVEVRSTVKPNPEAPPVEVGPLRVTYDISGTREGTIELDEASGWTIRGKVTGKLAGQARMESMSWPISIESTTIFEPFEE